MNKHHEFATPVTLPLADLWMAIVAFHLRTRTNEAEVTNDKSTDSDEESSA